MSQYEIKQNKVRKDIRSLGERFHDGLRNLNNFRFLLIAFIVLQFCYPAAWPLWAICSIFAILFVADMPVTVPLRMPKDIGGNDPSDWYELEKPWKFLGIFRGISVQKKYSIAAGIMYWGVMRADKANLNGIELWSTNSDCRTHVFLGGTTGSGKSESLYGITYNALCWGSGLVYADGKADINLPFTIWSLCRRFGREDDYLHQNLLSGDRDPFQELHNEKIAVDRSNGIEYYRPSGGGPVSNTSNPLFGGTADFQLQLITSLLPKAGGDGQQWQEKAINLADALIRCLRYRHLKGDLVSGIEALRHYMGLDELVKMYKEAVASNYPKAAVLPLYSYLTNGLSFDFEKIDRPAEWDPEIRKQHGFLTSQFARTLAMTMDSYGAIFNVKYPEIDMKDVLLNNRILVVSIPSMEKSPQEAEALGKLVIAAIRLMMAESLGSNYEGDREEILNSRPTASPFPTPIITDELSYYYAQGLAVMYAQARSLGFMMVVAVQDIQGLKRGSAGEETASLLANTKFKCCLALEDVDDTFELVKKAAGEGYFSTLSGFDYKDTVVGGWGASDNAQIQQRSRIEITDVKKLAPGQGFLIFKDSLVEFKAFYLDDKDKQTFKLKPRVNRFIQIDHPSNLEVLHTISVVSAEAQDFESRTNGALIDTSKSVELTKAQIVDPIAQAIINAFEESSYLQKPENASIQEWSDMTKQNLWSSMIEAIPLAQALEANHFLHDVRSHADELVPY